MDARGCALGSPATSTVLLSCFAFEGFAELKMAPYVLSSHQLSFTVPLLSSSISRKKCYLHLFKITIFLPPLQPAVFPLASPSWARVDQSRGGSAGAGRGAGSSPTVSSVRRKTMRASLFRWKIIGASKKLEGMSPSVRLTLRILMKSPCATKLSKPSAGALHFVSCLHGLQILQP